MRVGYREPHEEPRESDERVTIRRFSTSVEAELARATLASSGVAAFVVDSASFNPLLTDALGGVRVDVAERDLRNAEEVLRVAALTRARDEDDDDSDVVRCPRCELQYCTFGRPRLTEVAAGMGDVLTWLSGPFVEPRWRCQKCHHVWDDPAEGPRVITALSPDDPRPVMRLVRGHPGMGLFLGAALGALSLSAAPELGLAPLLASSFLGWLGGRAITGEQCSEPSCRAPLAKGASKCPRCRGTLSGVIRAGHEHYAAVAQVRRGLREDRERRAARRARKRGAKAK